MAAERQAQVGHQWATTDVFAADLVRYVGNCLSAGDGPRITLVGMPLWMHVDSPTLVELLSELIARIRKITGAAALDVETLMGDRRVYLDMVWQGAPIPDSEVVSWLAHRLDAVAGRVL